ncbi:MAG: HNH endonuclease [Agriterribacter sp.]
MNISRYTNASGIILLKDYPGYSISPLGKVYYYEEEIKPLIKKGRAIKVKLKTGTIKRELGLATLLASHFIPNPNKYSRIAFKDGDKYNCCVSNIEWISDTAFAHGTLFKEKECFNEEKDIIQKPRRKDKRKPLPTVEHEHGTVEIEGYPGYYISPLGRVYKNNRIINPSNQHNGKSLMITLSANGNSRSLGLAKLIAITFLPNPEKHNYVIFKDRDNRNCIVENIRWVNGKAYNNYLRSFKKDPDFGKKAIDIDPKRKSVVGYKDYYISRDGIVYFQDRILCKKRSKGKTDRVELRDGYGNKKLVTVARLVATAFIPNSEAFEHVIFKDGDKSNIDIENLQWVNKDDFYFLKRRNRSSDELLGVTPVKTTKTVWIDPERIPMQGFEGYFITPSGAVYKWNRLLKPNKRKGKALIIRLKPTETGSGEYKCLGLATLVAIHFLPNPRRHVHIIFKDRDHHNCHVDNIAWVDAQTFAYYSGLFKFHTGRKKIVLEREKAIELCMDEYLRYYYKTLDEEWLETAWRKIDTSLSNLSDWSQYRSECYMYFIDRARRFSIIKSSLGLTISHLKTLRIKQKQEISPDIPFGILLQTDESMRIKSGENGYRSKWSGRAGLSENAQQYEVEAVRNFSKSS